MIRNFPRFFALAATLSLAACNTDPTPVPTDTDAGTDTGTGDTGGTDTGTDTVVDPCEGLELCDAAGLSCDGDSLVDCAEDANGCLVATSTDCAADGLTCDADTLECVDAGCEDECDAEGTLCDGDSIASCFEGADGCLDIEITVCDEGQTCVEGEGGPVCEGGVDPCEGLELCDEEGTFCEDGNIVTCEANEDACIVRDVVECVDGTVCTEGEELTCAAPCEDAAECTEVGQSCDGDTLNSCVVSDLGCLELVTSDCAALVDGGSCDAAASICIAPGDPCADIEFGCAPGDEGVSGCEGTVFAICTVDAFGCGVVEQTECGDVDGGFCGDGGCAVVEPGACDDIPAEVACDEEGALTCGELGPIECQRDADGCLTLVDAGECGDEETCVEGVCFGSCDDVVECEAPSFCDEGSLVVCGDVAGCFVEVERTVCDFGCDDGGEAAICLDSDPCAEMGCDAEFDIPFCDGDMLMECVPAPDLACDVYVPTDCSETEGFSCVDDGFFAACEADPCGDGDFDGFVGEECDDGNSEDGDGCSSACELEEGFDCETVEGTSVCTAVVCGDGIINGDEECDDEDSADPGCDETCAVEEGFECIGEPSVCLMPICGDGVRNGTDSCDDGNLEDGDGCTSECFIELSDTVGDTAEIAGSISESDLIYERINADCTASFDGVADHYYDVYTIVNVLAEPIEITIDAAWSSDGYLHIFGSDFDPATPVDSCIDGSDDFGGTAGSRIADFVADPDTSYFIVASTFSGEATIDEYTLTVTTVGCGDGFVGAIEECDDGNLDDGDGCDALCAVEDTFECDDEPSFCWMPDVCGGGIVDGDEECDDFNTTPGDGCSDTCTVEEGFICGGDTSVCVPAVCGDGILAPGETCDDGNTTGGDGCSATCAAELGDDSTVEVTGALDGSEDEWRRANADCSAGTFADAYYDVLAFENTSADVLEVVATGAWSADGFLHAYNAFDPVEPTLECITGNDDTGGTAGSEISFLVDPLSSFELVVSTFGTRVTMDEYTVTVTSVVSVPAP